MDNVNSQKNYALEYESIIFKCRIIFNNYPQPSKATFVKREANMAAHSLTMVVIIESCSHLFFSISNCSSPLIINEVQ